MKYYITKMITFQLARVAQSVEHQAFNLRVQGSSPCSGEHILPDLIIIFLLDMNIEHKYESNSELIFS